MEFDWTLTGKGIWLICLIAWAAIRWVPNRRARKVAIARTSRTPSERFSMAMSSAGLGIVPAIWVFSGWPSSLDFSPRPLVIVAGAVLFAISLRLFRITHKALGAMWSHSLDLREDHRLVTSGIYEKIRHPMYTAFWLWAIAQTLLLANWMAALAGIVGFGTLFFLRVGQEEKMMEDRFGQDYRAYCARTKRLVPGIY